jgi:hypothetical protein
MKTVKESKGGGFLAIDAEVHFTTDRTKERKKKKRDNHRLQ